MYRGARVNAAIYQDILENFVLLFANKLYGEAEFIFLVELGNCPH